MIEIDHICLGVQNVYEGSERLRNETGLGNYEGGWFPTMGLANRIVPLGGDVYIEVEGVIDAAELRKGNPTAVWFDEQVNAGDVFIGWCARVSTRQELDALAKRFDTEVFDSVLRVRPDGSRPAAFRTPDTVRCWKAGLPNFFYFADMDRHPSRLPVDKGAAALGQGVNWMELGGTAEEMSEWLGTDATALGLRFNGGPAGLYAVAVQTNAGEKIIRRAALRSEAYK